MNRKTMELLRKLTDLDGVPGAEDAVRAFMREALDGLGEFEMDRLGSLVCKKVGREDSPRIMIPAHMDEVGFMVKDITEDGYLRFAPLGGWLDQTLLGHMVTVWTRKGPLDGVIGCAPPHMTPPEERDKVIKRKSMFIDVGACDQKHAREKLHVRIGDPIVPKEAFRKLGDGKHLLAKAWDDRIGCALIIELLQSLQKTDHPNTVFGVGTVQEEVGTRGAKTAADVVNPDFCIVLEVGLATDMPGIKGEPAVSLGKGPDICVLEGGAIPDRRFTQFVMDVAEKADIPHQVSLIERGSTDARVIHIHQRGVPSVVIGVPARYIHSHAGVIHADDYDKTLKLVETVVKELGPGQAELLTLS
ncbi:MAG: M42 family metallopeptidase [Candidatus Brocadiaceae bacterium]|nr:M42 family metallopeptidase [Candidatus Brocadiaceae bacterium]